MAFERVVGLGLCVLDHLYRVDDFAFTATRTRYRERLESPGGMVTTALAQAAALGVPASLISAVGDDDAGRTLARRLREFGVDTRGLVLSDRFETTVAVVLVHRETGERRFLVADRREIERAAPALDVSDVDRECVVLVDGHFSDQAMALLEKARACGARVVGDFSDARESFVRLLPWVDHAIVPLEFARAWGAGGPEETLRALVRSYGGSPVVTLGADGALAWIDGEVQRIPAVPATVRDTTGAGDVYHGAFAAGLCRGLDMAAALHLAARAAALSCSALGGTGRLLREDEIA